MTFYKIYGCLCISVPLPLGALTQSRKFSPRVSLDYTIYQHKFGLFNYATQLLPPDGIRQVVHIRGSYLTHVVRNVLEMPSWQSKTIGFNPS
jgi:hypothetical protein